ncbi:hypothetical protein [uncultured Sulfuricurvum sp.]|uniref:hypothetical protein n=1 Tax=uncultured Sulfuricurvum sp. TaxID=430693 RepID=UPI00260D3E6C|nr:hypothetical protein [uncultured Sulfuricurvum sp.]
MKNLSNLIEFKGIHINEDGVIHLSYTGDEGVLFDVSMSIYEDMEMISAKHFEIISKKIRQNYSPMEVFEFINTDLQGYVNLLSQIVLSIASLQEDIGEKVVCIDSLFGIQKFYDMEGNPLATSTNLLDKDKFTIYKML